MTTQQEIQSIDDKISALRSSIPAGITAETITNFQTWPRAFRLNQGTSALENVNKAISINASIADLENQKKALMSQRLDSRVDVKPAILPGPEILNLNSAKTITFLVLAGLGIALIMRLR